MITVGVLLFGVGLAGRIWPESEPTPRARPETPAPPAAQSAVDEQDVRAFVLSLYGAIQSGDRSSLLETLDPRVIEFYGEATCTAHLAGFQDPTLSVRVQEVGPAAPWDWKVDGQSTSIPEAFEVAIVRSSQGERSAQEIHVALSEEGLGWFTDCGDPL